MRLQAIAERAGALACAIIAVAGSSIAFAGWSEKSPQILGEGCVESGVEARCLVVKDVQSGALFNLSVKGVQPEIGSGIDFVGVVHHGMSTCMQGTAVDVLSWAHKDLKCTQGTAPKPKKYIQLSFDAQSSNAPDRSSYCLRRRFCPPRRALISLRNPSQSPRSPHTVPIACKLASRSQP